RPDRQPPQAGIHAAVRALDRWRAWTDCARRDGQAGPCRLDRGRCAVDGVERLAIRSRPLEPPLGSCGPGPHARRRMSETGFAAFHHRATYDAPQGRDRWVVPRVQSWITRTVPAVIGERRGLVVDVGCGEQPFRPLIESCGSRYVGLDVVQNSQGSVDIVAS